MSSSRPLITSKGSDSALLLPEPRRDDDEDAADNDDDIPVIEEVRREKYEQTKRRMNDLKVFGKNSRRSRNY